MSSDQQPQNPIVTSQPKKGSPPEVHPGGYPVPPYPQPYPGQPQMPGYPGQPLMPGHLGQPPMPGHLGQPPMPGYAMPMMNQMVMPSVQVPVQPQQMTSVNVNTNKRRVYRLWKAHLCACCKDPAGCLFVMLCPCCFLFWLSSQLDEACFMPLCVPYALQALRLKFRTAQRLKGSILEDWLLTCCAPCWMCVACQMKRELDLLGDPLNSKLEKIHATDGVGS